ncbi:LETM1-like protein-domain-containing protein [Lanmaoa asiatica]|nr:LETM1-like protein-domain-containing protein [Lanmaoa asiatica]
MSVWLPRSQQSAIFHAPNHRHLSSLCLHTLSHHVLSCPSSESPIFLLARQPPILYHPHLRLVRCESSSAAVSQGSSQDPKSSPPTPKEDAPLLTHAWKKVKHEATHYWHGSKLLVSEVRISARLQWKILHGESLTRRERRQLRRMTQDLFKLIPFAVFVIIPFMELLLPVALKLFPSMLLSTFEDNFAAEEKKCKLLRVRLEMAKFLQEALRESGLKANVHILGTDAFKEFFCKVWSTGEPPSVTDIINVTKLFDNDLTLDNLSHPHLRVDTWVLMCLAACQSRGIRAIGVSPARLRDELSRWIQLHLHNRVSGILLILGRAFHFDKKQGDDVDGKTAVIQSLESVMCGLPDNLLNSAELKVDSDNASYKQKLEVLQQQEQKEEDARRAKHEGDKLEAPNSLILSKLHPVLEEESARMTTEQLKELAEVLSVMSAKSSVLKERDELRALMEENLQAEEDPKSPSGALTKRIWTMLTKIDSQLEEYDSHVGSSLQMISADAQGRILVQDLEKALAVIKHRPDDKVGQAVIQKLDVDKDGFIEIEHVLGLVREEDLGIEVDDEARTLISQGREIQDSKPRKEDIVQE